MSKPWHDEARRMRASNMSIRDIADALGKKEDTVRSVVTTNVGALGPIHGNLIERHIPTVDKPVDMNRISAIADLARQFASGAINRSEFVHRLRAAYWTSRA